MATPATPTRTLVLMRHAAAGSAARDHDRPLTPDGVRTASEAGRWIRGNLPDVDFVICSTAVRTRQTLAATGVVAQTRFCDELYTGGVDEILEQVATVSGGAATLLVIGHAPTIPATARELVGQAGLNRADDEDARRAAGLDPAGLDQAGPDPAGPDPTEPDPAEPDRTEHGLGHFAAGSFAVLTATVDWAELPAAGAALQTVWHPAL